MKKTLLTFGLAAMLFASCATDPDGLNTIVPQGTPQIKISGDIDQQYATRVDENGFCDGDQVGLYGVNYTYDNTIAGTLMDEGNQVNNALYTYSTENGTFTSSGSFYYKDAQTNIDLYAYYPFAHPEIVNAYEFEVALDQNQGTGHAMSDFLWAKATNVTPSENKVGLRFSHRLSLANVILKEGTGFANGEFDNLSKSVLALNTTRTATIDLSTGIATAVGEPENEGIIMKATDNGFRAIVVPQSIVGATPLFAITIDGISYRFKRDVTTDYEAGKMAKFTITINRKTHTGTYELVLTDTSIEDWVADIDTYGGEARQYYVVHLDEAGELEHKIDEAKKNPAKIKNLKVSGKICAGDFDFMRDKMEILQAVNLKETKVVECWYYVVTYEGDSSSTNEHFEGALPSTTAERKEIANARAAKFGKKIKSYGSAKVKTTAADNIPYGAFKEKTTLAYFAFPEVVTKIDEYAFSGCSLLTGALVLPDTITEIGNRAFNDCNSLTTLDLPARVVTIGNTAFQGCTAMTGELKLPSTLKSIGSGAFNGCTFTGELILPDGLEELGDSAFHGCSKFTGDLRIPESVTTLNDGTFQYCTGLNGQLILHDGLSFEGERHFDQCGFQGELRLPAHITKIPVYCFAACQFSSLAPLPDGLIEIQDYAFNNCNRLMGVIEFPETLLALNKGAFSGCKNLEGIILPSELSLIKQSAFSSCYHINKIVCRATTPPVLQSNVFTGVAKDNFTLEVPEESINKYQADTNWKEFKRIAAHHDFVISRSQIRTLNAKHTRNLLLRAPANHAWSIESYPEWVTVTPSSGVGKTEVTITVNEMTKAQVGKFTIKIAKENSTAYDTETHNGRSGEVVFLLDGKDYRTNLKIEQYDYQYSDGDVLTVQKATAVDPNKGVNLVFMGDCFDARDIAKGTYLSGTNEAIEHFFAVEPYKTYRDYFNIYTVFGMSNDSGVGTVDTIRDTKFGSQYTLNEGILPDINTIIDYALKTESVTKQNFNKSLVVMVENTTEYGGICYMYGDGSAVAICPMSQDAYPYDFRGIVQHEAGGHGFAKLADEYIYHNAFIQTCTCNCCSHIQEFNAMKKLGWYRNLEATGDMNEVGWSHLIFNPKYSDIVDIYEGGYYHTRGIYRSEPVSCMNNNIPYFSAISRQEIVERIMLYSNQSFSITNFYANDVLDIQGNNTGKASVLDAAPTAISLTGAGKQMPPKYMGHSPFDK